MATIKTSGLVSEIRGKEGGIVFARNRGGAYVRMFVKPTNPGTPGQSLVRSRLTSLSTAWRTLLEELRIAWNNAAAEFPFTNKVGDIIYLSGQQLFVKFNQNLLYAGLAVQLTAPIPQSIAGIEFLTLDAQTNKFDLDFGPSPTNVNIVHIVRATKPRSAGISASSRTDFKQICTIDGGTSSVVDLKDEYEAVFGSLSNAEGQKIFVQLVPVETTYGQAGTQISASDIVD